MLYIHVYSYCFVSPAVFPKPFGEIHNIKHLKYSLALAMSRVAACANLVIGFLLFPSSDQDTHYNVQGAIASHAAGLSTIKSTLGFLVILG